MQYGGVQQCTSLQKYDTKYKDYVNITENNLFYDIRY